MWQLNLRLINNKSPGTGHKLKSYNYCLESIMMKLSNDIRIFSVALTIQKIHSAEKYSFKSPRFYAAYGKKVAIAVWQ